MGQEAARALFAAEVVPGAKDGGALRQITLALRVQNHFFGFPPSPAGIQALLALAPGDKNIGEE